MKKIFIRISAVLALTVTFLVPVYSKELPSSIPEQVVLTNMQHRIPFIGHNGVIQFAIHFPEDGKLAIYNSEGFRVGDVVAVADKAQVEFIVANFAASRSRSENIPEVQTIPLISALDGNVMYAVVDMEAGILATYYADGNRMGFREISSLDEVIEALTTNIQVTRLFDYDEMDFSEFVRLDSQRNGFTLNHDSRELIEYDEEGNETRRILSYEEYRQFVQEFMPHRAFDGLIRAVIPFSQWFFEETLFIPQIPHASMTRHNARAIGVPRVISPNRGIAASTFSIPANIRFIDFHFSNSFGDDLFWRHNLGPNTSGLVMSVRFPFEPYQAFTSSHHGSGTARVSSWAIN